MKQYVQPKEIGQFACTLLMGIVGVTLVIGSLSLSFITIFGAAFAYSSIAIALLVIRGKQDNIESKLDELNNLLKNKS